MSSSPAAAPPVKSEGVKAFGTVPTTVSQVNGRSSVSIAKPGSLSNTPHKPSKQDIAKLFQNPLSAPPSQASSHTSSPNIRLSNLPPSSQPPSIPSSVAGGNSTPRPPSKAGDLFKFGQISNKGSPLIFGPQSSIHAGNNKQESVQRTKSFSQNMFSMLNNESTPEATPKVILPRKRFVHVPWWKPVEGQEKGPTIAESEGSSDKEVTAEPEPVEMSDKDAKKKIEEDIKEFSAVGAEVYFTQLPAKHHPLLVDKLVSFAVELTEADAQLVSDLFSRASTKNLCTIADFESGFAGVLEFLEDIVIDAPMAFNLKLVAIMMKGPAFDDEQLARLASKTDSAKLLGLLSQTR
ncbi:hypothetical protein ARMGADRAFT_1016935 [Armillaria gallica]|uniref:MI domain-containing protein n=1 Tax=Armillaria gallica TaxID=47427 RepID=A0A2H3CUY9_ARMGA|nr:hypothetical protein ARMGADRAFT_1016935 [Armillaria gallica]